MPTASSQSRRMMSESFRFQIAGDSGNRDHASFQCLSYNNQKSYGWQPINIQRSTFIPDTCLRQQFINRNRSISCKAETPPNRSPLCFLSRDADRCINRSSASSILTLLLRGSGRSRCSRLLGYDCHPGRILPQRVGQSPNK